MGSQNRGVAKERYWQKIIREAVRSGTALLAHAEITLKRPQKNLFARRPTSGGLLGKSGAVRDSAWEVAFPLTIPACGFRRGRAFRSKSREILYTCQPGRGSVRGNGRKRVSFEF